MIDKKTFAYSFVIGFIFLTWYLYSNNDSVASIIANDGFQGIFWYIVSNPAYILLFISIYALNTEAGFWSNTIGSFFILYASDIISYPRLSPVAMPLNNPILASSDTLFITQLTQWGLSYTNSWTFYYLVLPILLIIASLQILGITNFTRTLIKP